MTSDFGNLKKSAAAYVAAKGYEHRSGVIKIMEPVADTEWKTKHPDKSTYALKRTTKIKNEGAADNMKQEWIVIDCEKQEKAEDNYNNMQRQKLKENALYRKNGAAMFIVLYGQLHSDIITIAKRLIAPDFTTIHKERNAVGLLSVLRSICMQNLTRSNVDPYLEQLKILTSTLSYVQNKGISNHNFVDAVHDQVFAAQSQCGAFAFGENHHIKVLNDDGISNLKDYFSFDQTKKDKYDTLARQLVCVCLIINNSLSSQRVPTSRNNML